ncbi:MAG: nucleoside phosphorylase [Proteobacteria bacterium]|nr:nucleoside phosphorylase [Desulfobacteraceae bacterium]MBU3981350.1 nucleoside phosphorylase [Pseudomonadota bacterium]MBU4013833.1 nucleoside phosphorylase [Pseudomonadota bacterium]MBU4069072.1 nucleoside phosphorylase [Pseudomonadota bacterium]MBU4101837.1 nucleoside phosphorylase [Pseudomonadota bacterium]
MDEMPYDNSIIKPLKRKNSPRLGPVAVLMADDKDLRFFCKLLNISEDNFTRLLMSKVYVEDSGKQGLSVAGPFIGAPYAVMLLETLIAWGARKVIFLGMCGAISPEIKIGDIVVPTDSIIDEGTSKHYNADESLRSKPSFLIVESIKHIFNKNEIEFHDGLVWTTDAVYRETREKLEYYQAKDALAVDMELSALFTVGRFRNIEIGSILVVSDELATYEWHPGFRKKQFIKTRKIVAEVIKSLCATL